MREDSSSNKTISRKKKVLIGIIAALLLGAAYFVFVKLTGLYIPCVFRTVTGFRCPGCGVSHMLRSIIEGFLGTITGGSSGTSCWAFLVSKLKEAAPENYFLFFTIPFIIFEIIYSIRCVLKEKSPAKINTIILYIYLGLLIAWGVVRNIFGV